MGKYIVLFQQIFSQYSSYRLHVVANIVYNFILPIITVVALSQARSVSGIEVPSLINYYILILLFLPFLNLNTQDYLSELTFSGEINNFLMKPISLYKWLITRELSQKLVSLIVFIPFALILISIFISRNESITDPFTVSQLILTTILSFILSFNLAFFVGIFSFWIDEFWTVSNIKTVLVLLLGGIALPYTLFPESLNNILQYTLFPYLVSWPVRVIEQGIRPEEVVIALIWIVITFISIRIFLKSSIKKYSFTAS